MNAPWVPPLHTEEDVEEVLAALQPHLCAMARQMVALEQEHAGDHLLGRLHACASTRIRLRRMEHLMDRGILAMWN